MRFKGDYNDNPIGTGRSKNKIENEIKIKNVKMGSNFLEGFKQN